MGQFEDLKRITVFDFTADGSRLVLEAASGGVGGFNHIREREEVVFEIDAEGKPAEVA